MIFWKKFDIFNWEEQLIDHYMLGLELGISKTPKIWSPTITATTRKKLMILHHVPEYDLFVQ